MNWKNNTGGTALYEHNPSSCLVISTDVHPFASSLLILTVYEHIVLVVATKLQKKIKIIWRWCLAIATADNFRKKVISKWRKLDSSFNTLKISDRTMEINYAYLFATTSVTPWLYHNKDAFKYKNLTVLSHS